jgi:hypothetical protein
MGTPTPTTAPQSRVVMAPNPYAKSGPTVFLSGSIDTPPATWQSTIAEHLSSYPSRFSILTVQTGT